MGVVMAVVVPVVVGVVVVSCVSVGHHARRYALAIQKAIEYNGMI
jgi:hypothetical protein